LGIAVRQHGKRGYQAGLRPRPQVPQYIRFGLLNQSITGGY